MITLIKWTKEQTGVEIFFSFKTCRVKLYITYNFYAINIVFQIGNREWVGYGFNGQPNYVDRPDFPLPAVRFCAETPDIKV